MVGRMIGTKQPLINAAFILSKRTSRKSNSKNPKPSKTTRSEGKPLNPHAPKRRNNTQSHSNPFKTIQAHFKTIQKTHLKTIQTHLKPFKHISNHSNTSPKSQFFSVPKFNQPRKNTALKISKALDRARFSPLPITSRGEGGFVGFRGSKRRKFLLLKDVIFLVRIKRQFFFAKGCFY